MFDGAADDLYSRAGSKTRQPIEPYFNWLIEKTYIPRVGKVRSAKVLLKHLYGSIAAAFLNFMSTLDSH